MLSALLHTESTLSFNHSGLLKSINAPQNVSSTQKSIRGPVSDRKTLNEQAESMLAASPIELNCVECSVMSPVKSSLWNWHFVLKRAFWQGGRWSSISSAQWGLVVVVVGKRWVVVGIKHISSAHAFRGRKKKCPQKLLHFVLSRSNCQNQLPFKCWFLWKLRPVTQPECLSTVRRSYLCHVKWWWALW